MPTTLSPIAAGPILGDETLAAADATGNVLLVESNVVLALQNDGAGAVTVTLDAPGFCDFGRQHDYSFSLPNDGVRRYLGPFQTSRARFGASLAISYSGVTSVTVAAITLPSYQGQGVDAETPPALGASPGTIVVYDQSDNPGDPEFVVADADGMQMPNDGETSIWIKNTGGSDRTVYVHGKRNCRDGFADDEVITVPAGSILPTLVFPRSRFTGTLDITYDSEAGLSMLGVRQEAFTG